MFPDIRATIKNKLWASIIIPKLTKKNCFLPNSKLMVRIIWKLVFYTFYIYKIRTMCKINQAINNPLCLVK